MQRELYENLYKTEEKYWWFIGQRLLLYRLLKHYYGSRKDLKLLDLGSGAGINIKVLQNFGNAYGIDISDDAIEFCRKRGIKIKKSDVMDIKFPANTFDVVTELGVFYHRAVTDDIKAMKEVNRILKQNGLFIMMDCANKSLFGKHDVAFQGIRRYSKKELIHKLKAAGFIMEKISYFNTLFFPLVYFHRKFTNLTNSQPKSEINENIDPTLNKILKAIYKTEIRGLKHFNYPFGVNIYAVARKK